MKISFCWKLTINIEEWTLILKKLKYISHNLESELGNFKVYQTQMHQKLATILELESKLKQYQLRPVC